MSFILPLHLIRFLHLVCLLSYSILSWRYRVLGGTQGSGIGLRGYRSRLGCQVKLTKELDGMIATLPSATRNMYVDGKS